MLNLGRSKVFINLTSRHCEVLGGGEPLRIPFECPESAEDWPDAVRELSERLAPVIEERGLKGAAAVGVYRSPTLSCQMIHLSSSSRRESVSAARIACAGATRFGFEDTVNSAAVVGRDRHGEPARTHLAAAADRIESAEAVAELITSSGLRVEGLGALECAVMIDVVRRAIARKNEFLCQLYIGRERSCFLVADSGRVRLFRQIQLGLDHLSDSLTALRSGDNAAPLGLSFEDAARMLHEHGIPGRDAVIDEARGIHGWSVMPLIQPILQRLLVELKQSLRFGLTVEERQRLRVVLTGPGGALPGFRELIADGIETTVEVDPDSKGYRPDQTAGPGSEIRLFAKSWRRAMAVNLLPPVVVKSQLRRLAQRGLVIGGAAAALFVAVDTLRLGARLETSQRRLTAMEQTQREMQTLATQRDSLVASLVAMRVLDDQIERATGRRPDWAATLIEVSRLAPDELRLTSIQVSDQVLDAPPAITLEGYVLGEREHEALQEYVAALEGSPLITEASLGAVQRSTVNGRSARRFVVAARVQPFLRTPNAAVATASTGGEGGGP